MNLEYLNQGKVQTYLKNKNFNQELINLIKERKEQNMIIALMMGRAGSKGFKNKNLIRINGKRLFEYPLIAAKNQN